MTLSLSNHLAADSAAMALRRDVRDGLTQTPKSLPPKWFYDSVGSDLFDQITRLPEYYPTRAEAEILRARSAEIAVASGADTLVELGSGTSEKTRMLLDTLRDSGSLRRFVPFDVDAGVLNAAGAAITYSYAYSSNRLLTCNVGVPSTFQFNFTGKNSYSAAYISSDDSAQGNFNVTGLNPGATQYVFNASYIRNGSETSKVRNQYTFTSNINIQSTDLTIDKSTQQIVSGTATVSISGAASNGKSFSYSGTITFSGGKQALLVLGNGNTYTITWS